MRIVILFKKEIVLYGKPTKQIELNVSNIDFGNNLFTMVVEPNKEALFFDKKMINYLMICENGAKSILGGNL